MMTIHKFPLELHGQEQTIEMPAGAEVLDVQVQGDVPMIWALVNPEQNKIEYSFRLIATGQEILEKELVLKKYIGTVQMMGGQCVFHLFGNSR